jgi:hypothetical protein
VTDIERLTDRVEMLERKVKKLRSAMYWLALCGIAAAGPEAFAIYGFVGTTVVTVAAIFFVGWTLKEPGRAWWDPTP